MWNPFKTQTPEMLKAEFIEGLNDLVNNAVAQGFFARGNYTGGTYDQADDLHNIYNDFGYPFELTFFNFRNMYRRFGPAKAVVNVPADLGWLTPPRVEGSEQFNKELEKLIKKTKLWNRLKGLDKRQRVGRYAALFIQVRDGKKPEEPMDMLPGVDAIVNLKPIYEGQLHDNDVDQDQTSPNFGNPVMYTYSSGDEGNRNERAATSFRIHPSRIIIAAEDADDGSIYGISALESIYNDLMDLRKIAGAGGEGFYQNTRNAPVINVKEGFKSPAKESEKEALEQEINDFISKYNKKFVAKGMEFQYPNISLDNPKDFAETSWNNISAGSGIASSFLRGNQTGVKAGDQDSEMTLTMIQSRRENFLTEIVSNVIDWMIDYKALPSSEYEIEWDDLLAKSEDDKLATAEKMATVNEKNVRGGGSQVYTEEEIREVSGHDVEEFDLPDESLKDEDGQINE